MTPTQVFSCECCEVFENTYFEEHLQTTAYPVNFDKLGTNKWTKGRKNKKNENEKFIKFDYSIV